MSSCVEPYHNRLSSSVLTVRQKQIGFSLRFPEIESGIDHMINQYGKLYYGTMLPSVFQSRLFVEHKNYYIKQLINADIGEEEVSPISFVLELCRVLLKSKWRWPALMNRLPDGNLECRSGVSRAIANILTGPDPWNQLPILFYEKHDFDVSTVLTDYVLVDSVERLQQIFKLEDPGSAEPGVNLVISYSKVGDIFWPRLESISAGIDVKDKDEFGLLRSTQYFDEFLLWRSRYQSRPTLHVHTDWPESISDVNSAWNIVHAGPSTPIIELIQGFGNRPGILEKPCFELHTDPSYTVGHTLYIIDDKKIDVGDFLTWMDLKHTTFIDENWKFIMYRKDSKYASTFVKIGRSV